MSLMGWWPDKLTFTCGSNSFGLALRWIEPFSQFWLILVHGQKQLVNQGVHFEKQETREIEAKVANCDSGGEIELAVIGFRVWRDINILAQVGSCVVALCVFAIL